MAIFAMVTTAKSSEYTGHALESFFRTTPFAEGDEFFLIDNDGGYQLPEQLRTNPITIVRNRFPISFAANANQAALWALERQTALVFLNNDVIFSSNWYQPFSSVDDSIVVPLSNREVQYTLPISASGETFVLPMRLSLDEFSGHQTHFEAIVALHQQRSETVAPLLKVIAAPFFVVKIPYQILKAVGGFDLRYGIGGGEDYDYCLRAHLLGFNVAYAQRSFLVHFGGKSIDNSAESRREESPFIAVFREKWGEQLTVLVFEDARNVVAPTGLEPANYQLRGFRDLVTSLLGSRVIPELCIGFSV